MASTDAQPTPEVIFFGLPPTSRRRRRGVLVSAAAAGMVLAGVGLWGLIPEPLPDFSASDLAGVYAGMVRADGQNQVSTLTRERAPEAPAEVSPGECSPLFEATLSNQFPAAALDGVSTYWLNEGAASISLFTYRYPDAETARRDLEAVGAAVQKCRGTPLTLNRTQRVAVTQIPVTSASGVKRYLSYLVSAPGQTGRFATDVFQINNTLTWQYRYDYARTADYSPQAAQQLMSSMISQMRSVQQAPR